MQPLADSTGTASTIDNPLTSRDVAAMLGVGHKTIERHAREGEIPAHFRLNRWYFFQSELVRWLKAEVHSALPTVPCESGGA
jgi:excisionase family DNA binding protein